MKRNDIETKSKHFPLQRCVYKSSFHTKTAENNGKMYASWNLRRKNGEVCGSVFANPMPSWTRFGFRVILHLCRKAQLNVCFTLKIRAKYILWTLLNIFRASAMHITALCDRHIHSAVSHFILLLLPIFSTFFSLSSFLYAMWFGRNGIWDERIFRNLNVCHLHFMQTQWKISGKSYLTDGLRQTENG